MGHLVGGMLLIASTAIGVGMLALPVVTGAGGFFPSMIIYVVCWAFMVCTALLVLEVSLSMPPNSGYLSMAEKLLGPMGKNVFWIAYLFLFITVMVAHVVGGGAVVRDVSSFPLWFSTLVYVIPVMALVFLGTRIVDRINLLLIAGVLISYFSFIGVSYKEIDLTLLMHSDWSRAWMALPILFTAFTFQVILPTLIQYMQRDVKKIRLAIFFGSLIPLMIYLVWEFLILGIVPKDVLEMAEKDGKNAVEPLQHLLHNASIQSIGSLFAFFAMTASFAPLALSFFDFLADGLKMQKKGTKKILLVTLSFGVPVVIGLLYPNVFLVALGYAGGISCAFLFGLMPPLLAWICRYYRYDPKERRQLRGGKPFLLFLMCFALLILAGEIIQHVV